MEDIPLGFILILFGFFVAAIVLTAIVIGFAMTALFLVVLLASRGSSGNDHVDGVHSRTEQEML